MSLKLPVTRASTAPRSRSSLSASRAPRQTNPLKSAAQFVRIAPRHSFAISAIAAARSTSRRRRPAIARRSGRDRVAGGVYALEARAINRLRGVHLRSMRFCGEVRRRAAACRRCRREPNSPRRQPWQQSTQQLRKVPDMRRPVSRTSSWLNLSPERPAARFVTHEMPRTLHSNMVRGNCFRNRGHTGQVAPIVRKYRISAGVSKLGPVSPAIRLRGA